MKKFPELDLLIDTIFVDSMEDDFINATGAWPEGYFFTDKNGVTLWKSTVGLQGTESLNEAHEFFLTKY